MAILVGTLVTSTVMGIIPALDGAAGALVTGTVVGVVPAFDGAGARLSRSSLTDTSQCESYLEKVWDFMFLL